MELLSRIEKIESSLTKYASGNFFLPENKDKHSLQSRMEAANTPGVGVAVINHNTIDWVKGYGVLKRGTDKGVTTETFFQACSVSKMVTTPLILDLINKGIFDLDVDINAYLKSWKVPESEFTQDQKVTLRGLLTHQSGICRPDGGFNWEEGMKPSLINILNGEFPASMHPTVVEFEPFSKWQYSNMGFVIIQLILEEYYKRPFARIANELLFEPLEMKESTFSYPLPPSWSKREASLHNGEGTPTYPGLIPNAQAHGGLITTTSDLALFGIALMKAYHGNSSGIITNKLAQMMFEQRVWVDDTSALGFQFGMGFGCFLLGDGASKVVFHPGGNDPGASSLIVLLPEKEVGAVIMTNGLQGFTLSIEILSAIAHEYHWED